VLDLEMNSSFTSELMYLEARRESRFALYVKCVFFNGDSIKLVRILAKISNALRLPDHIPIILFSNDIYLFLVLLRAIMNYLVNHKIEPYDMINYIA